MRSSLLPSLTPRGGMGHLLVLSDRVVAGSMPPDLGGAGEEAAPGKVAALGERELVPPALVQIGVVVGRERLEKLPAVFEEAPLLEQQRTLEAGGVVGRADVDKAGDGKSVGVLRD